MKKLIYILTFIWISLPALAQKKQEANADKLIQKGIEKYDAAEYDDAEIHFRKALAEAPSNGVAAYNLAKTHLEQDKNMEALANFEKAGKNAVKPTLKSKAYYNQGNIWYNKKNYEKAVEAYKNALRNNPNDEEARYNYALALQKLKKQNKNKKNNKKNKDKKKNQDKKKDNKKKDDKKKDNKKKDNKKKDDKKKGDKKKDDKKKGDKKKDDKKKDDKKKGDKKQDKGQNGQQKRKVKLSPQQVKQLLVALKNKEKKTQNKVKVKRLKGKGKKKKQEKDW